MSRETNPSGGRILIGVSNAVTRRMLIHGAAALAGGLAIERTISWIVPRLEADGLPAATARQAQAPASADALAARRAELAKAPIVSTPLGRSLTMLSGPGGNVLVSNGPDGKVLVDNFVLPAWASLKTALDGMGSQPVKAAIDTHWHFDHADNNAALRGLGAQVIAHTNTKTRLSQTHDVIGLHFDPAPPAALPTVLFDNTHTFEANGERFELGYLQPAHTDTDISIRCPNTNVLHLGDVYFSDAYPFIDWTTGGTIGGMIAAAARALTLCDAATKIIPGHGPLADRQALTRSHEMLITVRDAVQKLKKAGRTLDETVAAKPTAGLDAVWGKGFVQPDFFVTLVYNTL
jgi:glyoxylase-like metal-dependent hydrolase (beta-lactamase superfamily II)